MALLTSAENPNKTVNPGSVTKYVKSGTLKIVFHVGGGRRVTWAYATTGARDFAFDNLANLVATVAVSASGASVVAVAGEKGEKGQKGAAA